MKQHENIRKQYLGQTNQMQKTRIQRMLILNLTTWVPNHTHDMVETKT